MKKGMITKIGSGIAAFFLLLGVAWEILYVGIMNADFLGKAQDKEQIALRLQMSVEDIDRATGFVLDCAKGKGNGDNITVIAGGQRTGFLNKREQEHMRDIASKIKTLSGCVKIISFGTALIYGWLIYQKNWKEMCKAFLYAEVVAVCSIFTLGFWISQHTVAVVNQFHRIFFNNGLWILNPATDRLIWIFPMKYFADAVICLGAGMGVFAALCTACILFALKKDEDKIRQKILPKRRNKNGVL